MEDYKPNSHKFKEEQKNKTEEKEIKKVVKGTAKVKKNEFRKFTDVFISEDVSSVKSYILMDVLVPAIKKAISDIVTDGIDMILYGNTGGRSKKGKSKVSYRSYYDDPRENRHISPRSSRFNYDDIIFETRGEVEEVRDQMEDVIERYGFVTVADMYDMADLTAPYTSNKYGWTNIRTAEPMRVREGYILKLPRAVPID